MTIERTSIKLTCVKCGAPFRPSTGLCTYSCEDDTKILADREIYIESTYKVTEELVERKEIVNIYATPTCETIEQSTARIKE